MDNTINTKSHPLNMEIFGRNLVFHSVIGVFVGYGLYKFTAVEAEAIYPLTSNSPMFSWLYEILSRQGVSNLIGVAEIVLALMMAARPWNWRIGLAGSAGIAVALMSTLSFLVTTPGIGADGFIIKDIVLLGGALWSAGMAWNSRPVAQDRYAATRMSFSTLSSSKGGS